MLRRRQSGGMISVATGILLFFLCTVLLFNNEGRAVNRAKALSNIKDAVEIVSTDKSIKDGEMILVADTVIGYEPLTDSIFNIKTPDGSVKLFRNVEMYQWKESSSNKNKKTSYTYEKIWSENQINSSDFNDTTYNNPSSMAYVSEEYAVSKVNIGSYTAGKVFINKMNVKKELSDISSAILPDNSTVIANQIFISVSGNSTLGSPEVGDYTISYSYVASGEMTILGQKKGTEIISYYTENGDLAEVSNGILSKESLRAEKVEDNKNLTFGLRIALIVGIMISNAMIMSPITAILSYLPIIGKLINSGIGFIGFILGLLWSLIIIAIGWIVYRPLVGMGLLAIVGVIIFILIKRNDTSQEVITE